MHTHTHTGHTLWDTLAYCVRATLLPLCRCVLTQHTPPRREMSRTGTAVIVDALNVCVCVCVCLVVGG